MRIKAPLVLYMLDQKLIRELTAVAGSASATVSSLVMVEGAKFQEGGGNGQAAMAMAANTGLSRVRKSILLAALSGELDGGLGTGWFLRACKRLSSSLSGSLDASEVEKSGGIRSLLDRGGMGSEELRAFASQWIFGRGCPVIRVDWAFNRKRMVVELRVLQTNTTTDWYESFSTTPNPSPLSTGKDKEGGKGAHGSKGEKKSKGQKPSGDAELKDTEASKGREALEETHFPGPFVVRIREADGVTYEHELQLSGKIGEWQKFDVPFNTKYKRVRKGLGGGVGGSRWTGLVTAFLQREGSGMKDTFTEEVRGQEGVENEEDGEDEDEDGAMSERTGMSSRRGRELQEVDEGDILGGEEEARRRWAAVEWSEEAEATQPTQPMTASAAAAAAALTNASGNFEWLRVDADSSWLGRVRLRQEPPMWAAQLSGEGDVAAQLMAIRALALNPSPAASTTLLRAALEPRYHPGIRSEAVIAMARCRQGSYQRLSNLLCAGGWGRACHVEGEVEQEKGEKKRKVKQIKREEQRQGRRGKGKNGNGNGHGEKEEEVEEWMLLDGGLRGGDEGRVGRAVIRALGLVRGEERRRCIRLLLSLLRYYGVDEPHGGQDNVWAVCTLIAALGAAYCEDIRPDPHGGMDRRNWFQGGGWLGWTPPPIRRFGGTDMEEDEEEEGGHEDRSFTSTTEKLTSGGSYNSTSDTGSPKPSEEEMVFQEAMREVDRWMVREMERQRTGEGASYRGMILASCIRTIWQWMAARRLPLRWEPLVRWAEWAHGSGEEVYEADREVRCAALEGLLVLGVWREESAIRSWLLSLVLSDPDHGIRRWLGKRWVQVISSGRNQRSEGSDKKDVFGQEGRENEMAKDETIQEMMLRAFGGFSTDHGNEDNEEEGEDEEEDTLEDKHKEDDIRIVKHEDDGRAMEHDDRQTRMVIKLKHGSSQETDVSDEGTRREGDSVDTKGQIPDQAKDRSPSGIQGNVQEYVSDTSNVESFQVDEERRVERLDTLDHSDIAQETSSTSTTSLAKTQQRRDQLHDPILAEQVILLGSILWSYEQLERMVAVEVNQEEGPAGVLEEEERERDKARKEKGGKIRLKIGSVLGLGSGESPSTPQAYTGPTRWVNEDGEEEEMVDVDDEGDTSGYYGVGLTSALKARASATPKSPRRKRLAGATSKDGHESQPMEDKVKRKRQRTSRSVDNQRCRQWLKRIEAHRSAFLFLQPVDPVAHGAPDYLEVIKHPMDLGTIRQKLDAQDDLDIHGDDKGEKYGSQEMWKDVQLVLDNCYFYNPEGSYAYTQAQDLEVVAKRTWKKIFGANPGEERVDEESASITHPPEREITPVQTEEKALVEEKEKGQERLDRMDRQGTSVSIPIDSGKLYQKIKDELTKVLDTLREHPSASPFLVPVDPEALGIPTYRDVIKHPMDLGTMQAHLVSGQKIPGRPPYHEGRVGIEAFQADFQRIISNCRLFNGPDDWVMGEAKILEEVYLRTWSKSPLLTSLSSQEEGKEMTELGRGESKIKIKEPKPIPSSNVPNQPGPSKIRLKLTGLSGQSPAATSSATASPATKTTGRPVLPAILQKKVCFTSEKASAIVHQLLSCPSAPLFRLPVDWQGMGLTDYPEKVKEPMDLSTIQGRVDQNYYQKQAESQIPGLAGVEERTAEETEALKEAAAWEAFRQDLVRIFRAAFTYNPRGTFASQQATKLKGEAEKALAKAGVTTFVHAASLEVQKSRGLSSGAREVWTHKVGRRILRKLKSLHPNSAPFINPVDWKRLQIPHYPEVVKEPMDLGTVGQRVDEAVYEVSSLLDIVVREPSRNEQDAPLVPGRSQSWVFTKDEASWVRDVLLVFENCYVFNGPDAEVSGQARILEEAFWAELRQFKESTEIGPEVKKRAGGGRKPRSDKGESRRNGKSRQKGNSSGGGDGDDGMEEDVDDADQETGENAGGLRKEQGGWYGKAKKIWKIISGMPESGPFRYAVSVTLFFADPYPSSLTPPLPPYPLVPPTSLYHDDQVDAEALNVPDYYVKVTKPMDLASIRKRLDRGSYKDPQGFIQDVQQIRLNTELYNGKEHPVTQMAHTMEKAFDQEVHAQGLVEEGSM